VRDIRAQVERTRFAGVRWVTQASSTNDEVAALARAGGAEGAAVAADRQSAGRGRRGRSWDAPPGSSLLVSVLLRPPPGAAHLAPMAAGLAAVEACAVAASVEASLKWPNDVIVAEGKLGGILSEVQAGGAVVVGLGLNVDWRDQALPAGAASLAAVSGWPVDRAEVLAAYLVALDRRCDQPPGALVGDWRAACSTIGRRVRVELPDRTLEGLATAVTDDGRLLVDGRAVSAGDVVHLRPVL
jgi:BirA family transcriptional regulator, biotin operon repressor / biotin---[acetyl-CoA-carboxylase] ligase